MRQKTMLMMILTAFILTLSAVSTAAVNTASDNGIAMYRNPSTVNSDYSFEVCNCDMFPCLEFSITSVEIMYFADDINSLSVVSCITDIEKLQSAIVEEYNYRNYLRANYIYKAKSYHGKAKKRQPQ